MTHVVAELTYSQAYKALQATQKGNRGAPAYSRWVNRPAGRVLAALAYKAGLTPNAVTAISAVFSLMGILMIALAAPSFTVSLLIVSSLLLGYALDSADGQLARLTGGGSSSGEWLDHVIDMGKLCLVHGAVAFAWVNGGNASAWGPAAISVPILFITVSGVAFFGWLLADLLTRINRTRSGVGPADPDLSIQPAPFLRSILRLPSDYGLLALSFLVFAFPSFALIYSMLLVANAAILAVALPAWFGRVRASEVSP